ncbi:MAG: helix-turn-helix transcriptional regulator [Planctomycetota bacterium]
MALPRYAMLTLPEVAMLMDVTARTIRRWVRNGKLPPPWGGTQRGRPSRWRLIDLLPRYTELHGLEPHEPMQQAARRKHLYRRERRLRERGLIPSSRHRSGPRWNCNTT